MQTNELRLFVSSTFRDLMPEREVLIKKIFPKLRELCRERGAYFTEIDLRWGITAEEARTGKVVRICLEEIDKCRPYFIGIMGSRYGWQPDEEVLRNDPALAVDFPWLPALISERKSITEMEFLHGAITPRNTESAFIYSQHNTGEQTEHDIEHLAHVRATIRDAGVPLRTFLSADDLGELVLRDLTAIIERDFALTTEPDALTLMRQPHEAFSVNRRRSYVANPEYVTLFEEFVSGEGSPLVFTGRSGLGKSSLMAYLTHEYKETHDAFVVTHFVGASSSASGANDIIRHIMMEIKDRYSLTDELPTEDFRLCEEFPLWLAKVHDEKLVLAIDALNQLPNVDNELGWLPEFIPPNVRLALSTTEGISYNNIQKRSWQEVEVEPLTPAMRKKIAASFLEHYHKSLTGEQFDMIANNSKCESPLFLRTVLEELRVFGVYEEYETHLVMCLESRDERELFRHVLSRLEESFGKEKVRSVMRAIWAARYGLSENELLEITGLTRLDESLLLAGLEYHLMQPAGLFTFFHQYLRDAVYERYIASDAGKREAHVHIARYFADTPPTPRRRDEEPWQWIEAKENKRAIETLTDISLFPLLAEEARHYELLAYWTKLEANDQMPAAYEKLYENAKASHTPYEQAEIFVTLGQFLTRASLYKAAEKPLEEAVRLSEDVYKDDISKQANAIRELATVYLHIEKLTEAEKSYKHAIDLYSSMKDLRELVETETNLAVVYYYQGLYDKAITLQREALGTSISIYGRVHPFISELLNNLASYLYQNNLLDEAAQFFGEAIEIDTKTNGGSHPQTIKHYNNLAFLRAKQGRFDDALQIYNSILAPSLAMFGENHNTVGVIFRAKAEVLAKMGNYDEAENMCIKSIRIRTTLFGDDNEITVESYLVLAHIKFLAGKYDESYELYSTYYPIKKHRLGVKNHRTHDTANQYIHLLQKLEKREEIEMIYSEIPSLRA